MSIKSQKANMKSIHSLISQDLSYIHGDRESGSNGAKKQFHTKSKAFLRVLGNDLGLKEFKVFNNHGGIAVSGEITLMGLWADGSGVYFQLSQDLGTNQKFLYRSITHMSDYSGGQNQWVNSDLFKNQDYEAILDTLLSLRKQAGTEKTTVVNRHVA